MANTNKMVGAILMYVLVVATAVLSAKVPAGQNPTDPAIYQKCHASCLKQKCTAGDTPKCQSECDNVCTSKLKKHDEKVKNPSGNKGVVSTPGNDEEVYHLCYTSCLKQECSEGDTPKCRAGCDKLCSQQLNKGRKPEKAKQSVEEDEEKTLENDEDIYRKCYESCLKKKCTAGDTPQCHAECDKICLLHLTDQEHKAKSSSGKKNGDR